MIADSRYSLTLKRGTAKGEAGRTSCCITDGELWSAEREGADAGVAATSVAAFQKGHVQAGGLLLYQFDRG